MDLDAFVLVVEMASVNLDDRQVKTCGFPRLLCVAGRFQPSANQAPGGR
jgi:hypothetical protein